MYATNLIVSYEVGNRLVDDRGSARLRACNLLIFSFFQTLRVSVDSRPEFSDSKEIPVPLPFHSITISLTTELIAIEKCGVDIYH